MIRVPNRPATSAAGTGRGLLSRAAAAPSTRGMIRVRSALDSVPEARRLDARPFQEADTAVGNVGKAVVSGGELIARTGERLRQAEDTALLMKIDQQATEANTLFQVGLLSTDPKTWTGRVQNHRAELPRKLVPADTPEYLRRRALNNLDQELARLEGEVLIKSVMARASEVRETTLAAARAKSRDGKHGEAVALIDAAAPGVFDAGGKERVKSDLAEDADRYAKRARADALTAAQSEIIKSVDGHGLETTLADIADSRFAPGMSALEKEQLRNVAQSVGRDRSMSATAEVADLIAEGKMKNPADVDAYDSKFLGSAEREEIKVSLLKRQEAGEKARLADPEVQWGIYGDSLARVNRWNKEAPGAEREYFEIHKQAGVLPEDLRGEITEPLARKRGVKPPDPDKVLDDYVGDRLTRLYDRGVFGAFETPEAYNPRTGKFEKAIDPAKQDSANRVLAKTKRAMNRWLKENPNVSEDKADAAMQSFMAGRVDDEQAAELLEQFNNSASSALFPDPSATRPSPPDLSEPVSAAEKQTTGKVTKFGWAEDPHLDSNSAKRIAAFSGQEGEAAARKGEDHPNLLKRGDLAVSPDIESELRSEGVEPGDFIRVKLADGTTRVTRWMDRTSDKLTGRWDFYTPDGDDSHDGAAVISFSKIPAPKQ